MQQLFATRNYSVRDFEEWSERNELVLAPKFQRREVWSDKARSYLIDTIVRGKPIPKLYMRQDVNPTTRRTVREIVDGQQRLRTVLTFIRDGFKMSRAHHDQYGGKYFSSLAQETQSLILNYEFTVDLLQDMPDNEVYDLFARINTYSEKLRPQELRNAKWFGEFKSSVYLLAKQFVSFFEMNKLFTSNQILRMAEAEFVSDLLLASIEGIREGNKAVRDNTYGKYDDRLANRKLYEKRFRDTIDTIGGFTDGGLAQSRFRATRLFYPLYCAVYSMKFGLPRLNAAKASIRQADYPKLKMALEGVDSFIARSENAEEAHEGITLSADDRKFYQAYIRHWVHAEKRTVLTQYLRKKLARAISD